MAALTYALVHTLSRGKTHHGIQCLWCDRVSYNVHDITERYCGNCHRFHDDADVSRGTSQTQNVSDRQSS